MNTDDDTITWATLFDRGEEYAVTHESIEKRLRELRDE